MGRERHAATAKSSQLELELKLADSEQRLAAEQQRNGTAEAGAKASSERQVKLMDSLAEMKTRLLRQEVSGVAECAGRGMRGGGRRGGAAEVVAGRGRGGGRAGSHGMIGGARRDTDSTSGWYGAAGMERPSLIWCGRRRLRN